MLPLAHRRSPDPLRWRGASPALLGACIAAVGVGSLGWLALGVAGVARFDTQALNSFWMLQHPRLAGAEHRLINTVALGSFVVAASVLIVLAVLRRSPQLVAAVCFILLGANLSAEGLKAVTPLHHVAILASPVVTAGGFPSGHAAACMSLVLSAVLVAPASWRPVVGGLGALYAFAVAYALLVLGNHYPSDVIAGFLIAVVWALLGIAGLRMFSDRAPDRTGQWRQARGANVTTSLSWVVGLVVSAMAVSITAGPPEVATVATAVMAVTMACVGGCAIGVVAWASPR